MIRSVLLSVCLAGMVCAQQPGSPGPRFRGRPDADRLGGPMSERRLTNQLGLDAMQQNKVHTVIEEARVAQQGMQQKMSDLRTQLAAAVKSGNEPNIDRVSQDIAGLQQQQTSIHAKALAKIYGSLNTDQQARFERMMGRDLGAPGLRRGFGPGNGARVPQPRQQ